MDLKLLGTNAMEKWAYGRGHTRYMSPSSDASGKGFVDHKHRQHGSASA